VCACLFDGQEVFCLCPSRAVKWTKDDLLVLEGSEIRG